MADDRLRIGLEEFGVDAFKMLPLRGQIDIFENRADRTFRFAGATTDALVGVDVELRGIWSAVNAIDGANFDARFVFDADARLGDNVNHHGLTFSRGTVSVSKTQFEFGSLRASQSAILKLSIALHAAKALE